MKILVTGADGFIGSHLAEALVAAGHDVRAMVLYNSLGSRGWLEHSAPDVAKAMEVVVGDVRDDGFVRQAVNGCDVVLHLAALIAIPYSYVAPRSYVDTNVVGTLNVLQAARDAGSVRVVHTSTSEVYGTALRVPIGEDHPLQGQSPYSASKIGADQMALSFHRSFELPVTVVRPFNTYGPRQSARAVIPTIITQLAAARDRIRLGALAPTRDLNFVADTVRGFIAAVTADAAIGQVVNLGSGYEISVGDLARKIAALMGVDAVIEQDESRLRPTASEVERLLANASLAKRLMGWTPAIVGEAGLDEGLRQTIAWFRDPANLRLYRPGEYTI